MGSVYLLGWALGCLCIPRWGDVYGRRWPYLISMGASLVMYLVLILSKDINLTTSMFFLLGITNPGKSNISYVYLLEMIPLKM
jgi:MFS family permease